MSPESPSILALLVSDRPEPEIGATLFPVTRQIAARSLGCHSLRRLPWFLEDLVHEAAVASIRNVVRYRTSFRGTTEPSARAWLNVVVRNTAWTLARRETRHRVSVVAHDPADLERLASDAAHSPARPHLTARDALAILERVVGNPVWREMWLLHNHPDHRMSHEELARRYGRSPGTVAVTLSHVRRAIAGALEGG